MDGRGGTQLSREEMGPVTLECFSRLAGSRRSVRAFLPVAVAPEQLEQVFRVAQSAPSNCNTQPWVVHVVSGKKLAKLGALLQEAVEREEYSMDFPYSGKYAGKYRVRQHEAAALLYGAMGIARDDREARQQAFLRNFSFFGAPHVAFLFLPEEFSLREAADLGMYAQNLMLTMRAAGLGSCAQTALGFHANQVREFLGVPPAMKLLFGISFGYEDSAAPANTVQTGRALLSDVVVFHG